MSKLWHCGDCNSEFLGLRPGFCASCFSEKPMFLVPDSRNGIPYGHGSNRPAPKRIRPLMSAKEFVQNHVSSKKYDWGDTGFLLPISARLTVQGLPGCGKSTFARRTALSLSSLGIPVCLISTEEGLDSDTFVDGLKRAMDLLGMSHAPPSLKIASANNPGEILYYRSEWLSDTNSIGLLIIDSVYVHGGRDNEWYKVLSEDERHGLLTVHHLTTAGTPKGGLTTAYLGDAILTFVDGQASVIKNRFGALQTFDVHSPVSREESDDSKIIQFPKV